MKISLVIPAYNEEAFIGACLDAALKYGGEKLHEIIVVDNASTDHTADAAARYPGVRVVREDRKGTGHARQTGAEEATGDVIAYVDADSHLTPGWVEQIEHAFADERVVFLSGPYHYYESERYPLWLLNIMWKIFVPPVYWVVGYMGNGGNCAVRRSALMAVGGNDRSIAFYGDDTDLARRLHAVGKTLWRNNFNTATSGRRFDEQGIVATYVSYVVNFWWLVFFKRPYTKGTDHLTSQTNE